MDAYKDGFEGFLEGMQELDEEKLLAANESLELRDLVTGRIQRVA